MRGVATMPSLFDYAVAAARAPARTVGFYLRRSVRWSRGQPVLPHEPKDDLFDFVESPAVRRACELRAEELAARYDLAGLGRRSTRLVYRENLALLDNLERLLPPAQLLASSEPLRVLDVGSAGWLYVFGLERFFARCGRAGTAPRAVELLGVELDGHVLYPGFQSCGDHAAARAAQTANPRVQYHIADFLVADCGTRDVVTLFYPFVTAYALLAWGLPIFHFRPKRLLAKAVQTLAPGGLLVVCSQTTAEQRRLFELLADQPLDFVARTGLASTMVTYDKATGDRCGAVFRRRPVPGSSRLSMLNSDDSRE